MKNYIGILLIIICINSVHCQIIDTLSVSEQSFSIDRPDIDTVIREKHGYIRLELDTLFLVNQNFISEYLLCLKDYNYLQEKCEEVFEVGQMLGLIESEFDSLQGNIKKIEDAYEKSLKDNNNTISRLRMDNENLERNMNNAIENLKNAESLIKQERWNSLGTNLLWGVGGTAVGVLISGFIISIAN